MSLCVCDAVWRRFDGEQRQKHGMCETAQSHGHQDAVDHCHAASTSDKKLSIRNVHLVVLCILCDAADSCRLIPLLHRVHAEAADFASVDEINQCGWLAMTSSLRHDVQMANVAQ